MTLKNLENLARINQLKKEPFNKGEFDGLIKSAKARLKDADLTSLSIESRFDLTYNSAHSIALAALRKKGFRANNRFIVFQALADTMNVGPEIWRVLSKCHDCRNLAEYEGYMEVSGQLLQELLLATHKLLKLIDK